MTASLTTLKPLNLTTTDSYTFANVSATGNITGSYILGNGSQLTGIASSYGNADVAANLAAFGSNPISTTGNITAGYFLGNGSQLTGVSAGASNVSIRAQAMTMSIILGG